MFGIDIVLVKLTKAKNNAILNVAKFSVSLHINWAVVCRTCNLTRHTYPKYNLRSVQKQNCHVGELTWLFLFLAKRVTLNGYLNKYETIYSDVTPYDGLSDFSLIRM